MNIARLTAAMVGYKDNTLHDIAHLLKVWGLSQTIGRLNGLSEREQQILEVTALVHDIACPMCRKKYGGTAPGPYQEEAGGPLAREFLKTAPGAEGLDAEFIDEVAWMVEHHHHYDMDKPKLLQNLMEADFLVNKEEQRGNDNASVRKQAEAMFKTKGGKLLLDAMFPEQKSV